MQPTKPQESTPRTDSSRYIPGGVSSMNRLVEPSIEFVKGAGAYIWDADDRRYIDFHAAFAPHLLGHNHATVSAAVIDAISGNQSLFGSGPTQLEGTLAALLCKNIAALDKVTFLNTGSEATALAIKLSRAVTGKAHFIVMQGGYNGNTDELACNVFNTLDQIGPRVSPGEYPIRPLGTGTQIQEQRLVHVVNYNDLDSIRFVCERYPVAALITEPVLQNIGVIRPAAGYLQGIRKLADEFGFLMILDEVKTGFRNGLGGFAAIENVRPDLCTYGKAIANGYPIAVLGGKAKYMDALAAPNAAERPLVAGTYNGHPVGVSAAIATVQLLKNDGARIYAHLDKLGQLAEDGIRDVLEQAGVEGVVARAGSAFSFYFMKRLPRDFHDLLEHHDFERDLSVRRRMIEAGIYLVPVATKQCSISLAHTEADIEALIAAFRSSL